MMEETENRISKLEQEVETLRKSLNEAVNVINRDQWLKREEDRIVSIVSGKIIENINTIVGNAMKDAVEVMKGEKGNTPVV